MLRGTLSQNWTELLNKVCDDYNNTPNKKLGYLKPNEINTIYDSYKVRQEQRKFHIKRFSEPTFKEQRENQTEYDKKTTVLKTNDYVYLDFNENLFGKSFDVQVCVHFQCMTSLLSIFKCLAFILQG